MKRLFCLVGVIFILTSTSFTVFAIGPSNPYSIPEAGIEIMIPADFITLTRDVQIGDPSLSYLGLTYSDWIDSAKSKNIYLDAYNPDTNEEIVITMMENIVPDMNLLTDSAIDAFMDTFISMYAEMGVTINNYDYYQQNQAKFVIFNSTQASDGYNTYLHQYYTIFDNKAINITLYSYGNPITSTDRIMMKEIVDNTIFHGTAQTIAPPDLTPGVSYFDDKTGAYFRLPVNWEKRELSKDREFIDVKFGSTDYEATIMYGSLDLYEMLGGHELGIERRELDLSSFTKNDLDYFFELMFGEEATYDLITVNNTLFYKTIQHASAFDGLVSTDMNMIFTIKKGYMYTFQYNGGNANAHFDDFMSTLESLEFEMNEEYSIGDIWTPRN